MYSFSIDNNTIKNKNISANEKIKKSFQKLQHKFIPKQNNLFNQKSAKDFNYSGSCICPENFLPKKLKKLILKDVYLDLERIFIDNDKPLVFYGEIILLDTLDLNFDNSLNQQFAVFISSGLLLIYNQIRVNPIILELNNCINIKKSSINIDNQIITIKSFETVCLQCKEKKLTNIWYQQMSAVCEIETNNLCSYSRISELSKPKLNYEMMPIKSNIQRTSSVNAENNSLSAGDMSKDSSIIINDNMNINEEILLTTWLSARIMIPGENSKIQKFSKMYAKLNKETLILCSKKQEFQITTDKFQLGEVNSVKWSIRIFFASATIDIRFKSIENYDLWKSALFKILNTNEINKNTANIASNTDITSSINDEVFNNHEKIIIPKSRFEIISKENKNDNLNISDIELNKTYIDFNPGSNMLENDQTLHIYDEPVVKTMRHINAKTTNICNNIQTYMDFNPGSNMLENDQTLHIYDEPVVKTMRHINAKTKKSPTNICKNIKTTWYCIPENNIHNDVNIYEEIDMDGTTKNYNDSCKIADTYMDFNPGSNMLENDQTLHIYDEPVVKTMRHINAKTTNICNNIQYWINDDQNRNHEDLRSETMRRSLSLSCIDSELFVQNSSLDCKDKYCRSDDSYFDIELPERCRRTVIERLKSCLRISNIKEIRQNNSIRYETRGTLSSRSLENVNSMKKYVHNVSLLQSFRNLLTQNRSSLQSSMISTKFYFSPNSLEDPIYEVPISTH